MSDQFTNKKTATIYAPVANVWRALTDPRLISQYFFGVEVHGEWKEGNTITYRGEWQGRKFESKGKVLRVEDQKKLQYSYWSDMSGTADKPENYHIITYSLEARNDHTILTMTEENLLDEEMKERSAGLWDLVFQKLKQLLEKENAPTSAHG